MIALIACSQNHRSYSIISLLLISYFSTYPFFSFALVLWSGLCLMVKRGIKALRAAWEPLVFDINVNWRL